MAELRSEHTAKNLAFGHSRDVRIGGISSVIALAKGGNGRKPPKADDNKAPPSQPQETEGVRHERP